jgi:hypothetical protein
VVVFYCPGAKTQGDLIADLKAQLESTIRDTAKLAEDLTAEVDAARKERDQVRQQVVSLKAELRTTDESPYLLATALKMLHTLAWGDPGSQEACDIANAIQVASSVEVAVRARTKRGDS